MTKNRLLLEAITEIQSSWVNRDDIAGLFELILNKLLALSDSEYGFVGEILYKDQVPYLKTHAITNIAWDQASTDFYQQHAASGMEFYNLQSLYGEVITTGQPVIANSPYTDPRRGGLPDGHPHMHAFMGLPLIHNDELLGMVGVANRCGGYNETVVDFLQPFLSTCTNILLSCQLRLAYRLKETDFREREKLLLNIMERIPTGILVLTSDGKPYYMNQTATHVVGNNFGDDFTLSQLPEHCQVYLENSDQLYDSDNLPIVRALKGEAATAYDMEIRKEGKNIPLQVTATPIRNESGTITHAVAVFSDISQIKQEQARTREQETLHRALLDSSIDAIINIDEQANMIMVNPAAEKMFGYSKEELLGRNVKMLVPEPDRSRHDQYIRDYLKTGRAKIIGIGREVEAQCKDGHLIPCHLTITEVKLPGKRFFKGIMRDISDRKRIEQMERDFIATVSHELRTPLTSISGSLKLLLGGVGGGIDPLAKELLEIANSNADRLILLVSDILDMEKLESGSIKFDLKPQRLIPLIEQAVAANQAYAELHETRLQFTARSPDVSVILDKDRFIQVLTNLLSNAAKFSHAGRPVQIFTARSGNKVRVTVADEGPGIPDTFKTQIFKKFAQADHSDSTRKGGTGLGLCISKTLVERMGGQIGYDSEPGKGSRFYVELPIYESRPEKTSDYSESTKRLLKTGQRVLVCEDEPDVAKLLKIMLEKSGLQADVAQNWEQATRLLESSEYDAMTLDLMLPDIHWMSLFKALRTNEKTRHLPVIVVSAIADDVKYEFSGNALNIFDWLSKPIDEKRLIEAVTGTLSCRNSGNKIPTILYVGYEREQSQNIASLLAGVASIVVVRSVEESKVLLAKREIDMIIIDMSMPEKSELQLLSCLDLFDPQIPVVLLSGKDIDQKIAYELQKISVKSPCRGKSLIDMIQSLIDAKM